MAWLAPGFCLAVSVSVQPQRVRPELSEGLRYFARPQQR